MVCGAGPNWPAPHTGCAERYAGPARERDRGESYSGFDGLIRLQVDSGAGLRALLHVLARDGSTTCSPGTVPPRRPRGCTEESSYRSVYSGRAASCAVPKGLSMA